MDDERAHALAVIRSAHQFPVIYEISVIALTTAAITAGVRAAIEVGLPGGLGPDDHQTVPSSGGKFTSHRFRVPCATAEEVLELIARVRAVPGVITTI
jgi:hypothetical protein